MLIGLVGLGRMGGNMMQRLRAAGHDVVGFDVDPASARDVDDLPGLVAALDAPRTVWVMVPAGEPTRAAVRELAGLLEDGDLLVDGGNSRYTDDAGHTQLLGERGVGYVDVGVSGGVHGLREGYGVMVGGAPEHVARLQPIFDALTPEVGGFVHAGPVGAGHFAKMVHNGIEYGLMQAYGEGYQMLRASPLVHDPDGVVGAWQHGTVIRSWLLDLLVAALGQDPALEGIRGEANDSGEGRWAVQAAVDLAVPAPVMSAALYARFASREEESVAMQVVAALRQGFGGHAVTPRESGVGAAHGDARTT